MPKKTETKTEKVEREYVIPLREKCRAVARHKKTPKAVKTIKEFLVRHMKIYDRDLKKIKLDKYLNEYLWQRGIKNPPHKIKVKAIQEGDIVKVELVEIPGKLKFKKAREERREKQAKEVVKKKKAEEKELEKKVEEKPEEEKPKEQTEEEKAEEKEKKAAVVEAGKERGKAAAKQIKHMARQKTKQPKRQVRVALAK